MRGSWWSVPDSRSQPSEWNRWADAFFPGGADDPDVGVLRVEARSAEYWTGPDNIVDKVTGTARALIGKDPSGLGHHARINLG